MSGSVADFAARGLPAGPALSAADTSLRWLTRPYAFLDECAASHGDTFTLDFGRHGTHVVLCDPSDVRDVFAGDPAVLCGGRGNALLEPILGTGSLLLADGERHLEQRSMLAPPFRADRIGRHGATVAAVTRRRTLSWQDSATLRLQPVLLDISREVILRVAFGIDEDEEIARLSRLIHSLMSVVGANAALDDPRQGPVVERFHAARAALAGALLDHVERRRSAGSNGHEDVVSALLAARSGPQASLTDQEIADQLITMVLAGHETTASSVAWALVCLTGEPAAMRALVAELDAAGPGENGIASSRLLQAACLETLRLRPVVPVVSRLVQRPFRLGTRTFEPGIHLTPCAYLAHRREQSFADPHVFAPRRFLEQRYPPHVYFPFGGGVRRCIGMSFALLEMQIVLGELLRSFVFEAIEPRVAAVRRVVTIMPAGGTRMLVRRREQELAR